MPHDIGRKFLELTGPAHFEKSAQMEGKPQPPLELPVDAALPVIPLPAPDEALLKPLSVAEAIGARESVRTFAQSPLTLEELAFALWCAQGVQKREGAATFRTVPSAGARHAFELFVLVNNVEGLSPGLYRYLALDHRLAQVSDGPEAARAILRACLDQPFIRESAATFLLAAVPERMTWRYGQRGYRYLFLDAGHVGQNLYLAGEALDCGVCAVGAFMDDDLNAALGLDGEAQFVIYLLSMGKKKRDTPFAGIFTD